MQGKETPRKVTPLCACWRRPVSAFRGSFQNIPAAGPEPVAGAAQAAGTSCSQEYKSLPSSTSPTAGSRGTKSQATRLETSVVSASIGAASTSVARTCSIRCSSLRRASSSGDAAFTVIAGKNREEVSTAILFHVFQSPVRKRALVGGSTTWTNPSCSCSYLHPLTVT